MAGGRASQSRREREDSHRERRAELAAVGQNLADGGGFGGRRRREASRVLEGAGVHPQFGGAVEAGCELGEGRRRYSAAQTRSEADPGERGALARAGEAPELRGRARNAEPGASRRADGPADLDDGGAAGGGERESAQRGEDYREVAAKPAE